MDLKLGIQYHFNDLRLGIKYHFNDLKSLKTLRQLIFKPILH